MEVWPEVNELEDFDDRPRLLLGFTSENLARIVRGYVRTTETPAGVAELLSEARRTFVGASTCYDNLASAALKALQAAELALRIVLGESKSRATLGQLLAKPEVDRHLGTTQIAWFRGFALHFRNRLAHPRGSTAMTPGMAEPFLRTAHEVVAALFPEPVER